MPGLVPRCTKCATALAEGSGRFVTTVRSFFRRAYHCPHCKISIPKSSAAAMGQAYGSHLSHLKSEVSHAAKQLKRLEINEALRAFEPGLSREQIHRAHTIENVVRFARELYRPVLMDEAHGRHANMEVGLKHDDHGQVVAAGVWGCTSAEHGEREWDMLFARVGTEQYIVYQPTKPTLWLHEAIRHKHEKPGSAISH